jgi:hypothetical protein
MKSKTKIISIVVISILISLVVSNCQSNTEPSEVITNTYLPAKQEAQNQTEKIVNETLKQSISTLLGYQKINTSPTLAKTNSEDYHYLDNWHVWRGHITKSPFNIEDSYNAEYLAKVQFRNSSGAVVQYPNDDTKYLFWYFKAHGALGFTNSEPYGDEVWYDVEGSATPLKANPTLISIKGSYDRRWVGVKDGQDSEFLYKAKFDFHNLEFYYSFDKNDYWLNGTIEVNLEPFILKVKFDNSRTAETKVYKDGELKNTYTHEYPNFYEIYNIPSLQNWELGLGFEFPGPIPL